MDLEIGQMLLLACSVQCFLLIMLLESRARILAMLSAAIGFSFFLTAMGWALIADLKLVVWIEAISHSKPAWFALLSILFLSAYAVRSFPPPDAEARRGRR